MKTSHRTALSGLLSCVDENMIHIRRFERAFSDQGGDSGIPDRLSTLQLAATNCIQSLDVLAEEIRTAFEADAASKIHESTHALSESEIPQLLQLNRQLSNITQHLRQVAQDAIQRLELKNADPNDPMFDYEIEARIDYVLREGDPDYCENDDNYLTRRSEDLKCNHHLDRDTDPLPFLPAALPESTYCWLFRDLYDRGYGPESPMLSLKDCLRIGNIFVDVQITQQYVFDAQGGSPCESKRSMESSQ